MSEIRNEVLRQFGHISLTSAALLLFFGIFVGAVVWVFRRGGMAEYERASRLPLETVGESYER